MSNVDKHQPKNEEVQQVILEGLLSLLLYSDWSDAHSPAIRDLVNMLDRLEVPDE